MPDLSSLNLDVNSLIELVSTPSFKTVQLAVLVYFGLLWLAVIIWVTRDAINRSESLLFQVFAILLNIIFPILGILLYLIIRPSKTTLDRYYEELEHRLILESISEKKGDDAGFTIKRSKHAKPKKTTKKKTT